VDVLPRIESASGNILEVDLSIIARVSQGSQTAPRQDCAYCELLRRGRRIHAIRGVEAKCRCFCPIPSTSLISASASACRVIGEDDVTPRIARFSWCCGEPRLPPVTTAVYAFQIQLTWKFSFLCSSCFRLVLWSAFCFSASLRFHRRAGDDDDLSSCEIVFWFEF